MVYQKLSEHLPLTFTTLEVSVYQSLITTSIYHWLLALAWRCERGVWGTRQSQKPFLDQKSRDTVYHSLGCASRWLLESRRWHDSSLWYAIWDGCGNPLCLVSCMRMHKFKWIELQTRNDRPHLSQQANSSWNESLRAMATFVLVDIIRLLKQVW